jgi:hypothetical protein
MIDGLMKMGVSAMPLAGVPKALGSISKDWSYNSEMVAVDCHMEASTGGQLLHISLIQMATVA